MKMRRLTVEEIKEEFKNWEIDKRVEDNRGIEFIVLRTDTTPLPTYVILRDQTNEKGAFWWIETFGFMTKYEADKYIEYITRFNKKESAGQ